MKQSLFETELSFMPDTVIEFKQKKWKIISRSKLVRNNEIIDYFIVALNKQMALSFLESDIMNTYHIDNWYTFSTKFFNQWLNKKDKRK